MSGASGGENPGLDERVGSKSDEQNAKKREGQFVSDVKLNLEVYSSKQIERNKGGKQKIDVAQQRKNQEAVMTEMDSKMKEKDKQDTVKDQNLLINTEEQGCLNNDGEVRRKTYPRAGSNETGNDTVANEAEGEKFYNEFDKADANSQDSQDSEVTGDKQKTAEIYPVPKPRKSKNKDAKAAHSESSEDYKKKKVEHIDAETAGLGNDSTEVGQAITTQDPGTKGSQENDNEEKNQAISKAIGKKGTNSLTNVDESMRQENDFTRRFQGGQPNTSAKAGQQNAEGGGDSYSGGRENSNSKKDPSYSKEVGSFIVKADPDRSTADSCLEEKPMKSAEDENLLLPDPRLQDNKAVDGASPEDYKQTEGGQINVEAAGQGDENTKRGLAFTKALQTTCNAVVKEVSEVKGSEENYNDEINPANAKAICNENSNSDVDLENLSAESGIENTDVIACNAKSDPQSRLTNSGPNKCQAESDEQANPTNSDTKSSQQTNHDANTNKTNAEKEVKANVDENDDQENASVRILLGHPNSSAKARQTKNEDGGQSYSQGQGISNSKQDQVYSKELGLSNCIQDRGPQSIMDKADPDRQTGDNCLDEKSVKSAKGGDSLLPAPRLQGNVVSEVSLRPKKVEQTAEHVVEETVKIKQPLSSSLTTRSSSDGAAEKTIYKLLPIKNDWFILRRGGSAQLITNFRNISTAEVVDEIVIADGKYYNIIEKGDGQIGLKPVSNVEVEDNSSMSSDTVAIAEETVSGFANTNLHTVPEGSLEKRKGGANINLLQFEVHFEKNSKKFEMKCSKTDKIKLGFILGNTQFQNKMIESIMKNSDIKKFEFGDGIIHVWPKSNTLQSLNDQEATQLLWNDLKIHFEETSGSLCCIVLKNGLGVSEYLKQHKTVKEGNIYIKQKANSVVLVSDKDLLTNAIHMCLADDEMFATRKEAKNTVLLVYPAQFSEQLFMLSKPEFIKTEYPDVCCELHKKEKSLTVSFFGKQNSPVHAAHFFNETLNDFSHQSVKVTEIKGIEMLQKDSVTEFLQAQMKHFANDQKLRKKEKLRFYVSSEGVEIFSPEHGDTDRVKCKLVKCVKKANNLLEDTVEDNDDVVIMRDKSVIQSGKESDASERHKHTEQTLNETTEEFCANSTSLTGVGKESAIAKVSCLENCMTYLRTQIAKTTTDCDVIFKEVEKKVSCQNNPPLLVEIYSDDSMASEESTHNVPKDHRLQIIHGNENVCWKDLLVQIVACNKYKDKPDQPFTPHLKTQMRQKQLFVPVVQNNSTDKHAVYDAIANLMKEASQNSCHHICITLNDIGECTFKVFFGVILKAVVRHLANKGGDLPVTVAFLTQNKSDFETMITVASQKPVLKIQNFTREKNCKLESKPPRPPPINKKTITSPKSKVFKLYNTDVSVCQGNLETFVESRDVAVCLCDNAKWKTVSNNSQDLFVTACNTFGFKKVIHVPCKDNDGDVFLACRKGIKEAEKEKAQTVVIYIESAKDFSSTSQSFVQEYINAMQETSSTLVNSKRFILLVKDQQCKQPIEDAFEEFMRRKKETGGNESKSLLIKYKVEGQKSCIQKAIEVMKSWKPQDGFNLLEVEMKSEIRTLQSSNLVEPQQMTMTRSTSPESQPIDEVLKEAHENSKVHRYLKITNLPKKSTYQTLKELISKNCPHVNNPEVVYLAGQPEAYIICETRKDADLMASSSFPELCLKKLNKQVLSSFKVTGKMSQLERCGNKEKFLHELKRLDAHFSQNNDEFLVEVATSYQLRCMYEILRKIQPDASVQADTQDEFEIIVPHIEGVTDEQWAICENEKGDLIKKFNANFGTITFSGETMHFEGMSSSLYCEESKSILKDLEEFVKYLKSLEFDEIAKDLLMKKTSAESIEEIVRTSGNGNATFIKSKNKVVTYGRSYEDAKKIRHRILVSLGIVKPTGRKKTTENTNSNDNDQPQIFYHQAQKKSVDFQWERDTSFLETYKTSEGIQIYVYKADITNIPVDCIVNAANETLQHGGGVAAVISKSAGKSLDMEGDQFIKSHGLIKVGMNVATTAGNLPYQKVIHAVGPRWSSHKPYSSNDVQACEENLYQTIYNSLETTEKLGLKSVGIPAISSAIFGVPIDLCVCQYVKATLDYSKDRPVGKGSLLEIHFIDINAKVITAIQDEFKTVLVKNDVTQYDRTNHVISRYGTGRRDTSAGKSCFSSSQRHDRKRHSQAEQNNFYPARELDTWYSPVEIDIENGHCFAFSMEPLKRLLIYKGDVTGLNSAVLVMTIDEYGNLNRIANKVFNELAQGMQPVYKNALKKALEKKGKHVGQVVSTKGFGTIYTALIHVVTPKKGQMNKRTREENLNRAFCNVLTETLALKEAKTLAVPLFGIDYTKSDETAMCANAFLNGFGSYLQKQWRQSNTMLDTVHFVCQTQTNVDTVYSTFKKHFEIQLKEASKKKDDTVIAESLQPGIDVIDDCVICMDKVENPKRLKCGHIFCADCIRQHFDIKKTCPTCGHVCGIIEGDQPDGVMKVSYSSMPLSGYPDCGQIIITYDIHSGRQKANHPNPGQFYNGIRRMAYLPDNLEGQTVLKMLRVAFDRKLVFTIGRSRTTGQEGVVTWNDIHHKTDWKSNSQFGYPDPTYLARVKDELAAKGVTEEDID